VFLRGGDAPPLDLPRARPAGPPAPRTRTPSAPLEPGPDAARAAAARCLACGACGHCRVCVDMFSCPAITLVDGRVAIDAIACTGCGVCAQICPNGAIERIDRPEAAADAPRSLEVERGPASAIALPVVRRPAPPRRPGSPLRIVLAGVGGQGSLFASRTLGQAALDEGLDVVMSELHGMSQRGGVVVSTVILGEAFGPIVVDGDADVLVGFEPLEAVRALRFCSERTVAVVNLHEVPPPSVAMGGPAYPSPAAVRRALETACGRVVTADAAALAERSGAPRAANAVVLGMLAQTGVLPFPAERLERAIRASLRGAPEAVLAAFAAGRGAAG
jgi:indolepyruvate ferredoxin oxidoreductase beta subunit